MGGLEEAVMGLVHVGHAAAPDELLELVPVGDHVTEHGTPGRGGHGLGRHLGRTREPPIRLRENRVECFFPDSERFVELGLRAAAVTTRDEDIIVEVPGTDEQSFREI